MRIDMHIHIVGFGTDLHRADEDVYYHPGRNHVPQTRLLHFLLERKYRKELKGVLSTGAYLDLLFRLLASSEEIRGAVLLALDAPFEKGASAPLRRRTDLWVSNRFAARAVRRLNRRLRDQGRTDRRFFFAGSVNPNRRDWSDELAFVLDQPEAVALKLIPSVHHVDLLDPDHRAFHRALADAGLPLLCHVGPEYAFPEGYRRGELDRFPRLRGPLEQGATVVAAHCASPVLPGLVRNEIRAFDDFLRSWNRSGPRLYADTSALSMAGRIPVLGQILETLPLDALLHGSDFPIPASGRAHLPGLAPGMTLRDYRAVLRTDNPLDRDVRIKRAVGFPDDILSRPAEVLRLPRGARQDDS